ncbi:MAG: hypothetical protein ACOX50_00160 [Patescibacteria group bacterium]|jgi:tetratricopeptide (TPR) repeat protein
MRKVFFRAAQSVLVASIFLLPIVFVPAFAESYDFGKQIVLLVGAFLAFVFWIAQSILDKKLVYKKSRYLTPSFLVLLTFVASTFVNSSNKTQSFATATGVGAILLCITLYSLLDNLVKKKVVLWALLGSSLVLALVRIVLFLGNFNFPVNISALNLVLTRVWSPTGSLIAQAIFAFVMIPVGFSLMYEYVKQQKLPLAAGVFLINTLSLVGLGLSFYLLTSEAKPILLPQGTAWAIALEGLKNSRFAVFGLGPGQFINAFTSFKSLGFNASDYWNLRFGSSSNWLFQLLTEVGIVGLLAYLLLTWRIFKDGIKVFRAPRLSYSGLAIYLSLVILLVAQLFIPLNFFLLALMFVFLGISRDEEQVSLDFAPLGKLALLALVPPVVLWAVMLFFAGKWSLASNYFLTSIKAANANDGVRTYNMQIKAIATDPSVPGYRVAYSQTNLALANSLAAKQDLTDQDRNTITQLVQQAIREAKAAVAVDPRNASAWENLASLYRNLINFAEGAEEWSVASYQQAINLDPLNPRLRVDLGGLYYSQQNWAQAANLFAQAVNLKSDWANAHYNLASALKEGGDLQNAKREYEVTQTLVTAESTDYQKVTTELEELKKRLPTPTPTPANSKAAVPTPTPTPETLQTPQPPAEGINPPIELPNGGPEVTPAQ